MLKHHFISLEIQTRQMSYWSKQIIAREVELEKMRRSKPKMSETDNKEKSKKQNDAPGTSKTLPNHLQRLIPKAIKSAKPTQVVSCSITFAVIRSNQFFRRFIKISSVVCQQSHQLQRHRAPAIVTATFWLEVQFGTSSKSDLTTQYAQT